ncbi:MAG: hypothetical protein IKQ40_04255 [Lachnospiraceae bacterium]|nr:hypothetical protein [Lachnospiraceae bacterium]
MDGKTPFNNIRLSCNALKIIACISMLIDHTSYGILHNYMLVHSTELGPAEFSRLQTIYEIGQGIGRIAFPIFCFFLVEGFMRTRSVKKYAIRLAVFALISELPFDLGLFGLVMKNDHQNIILSFFIALMMLSVIRYFENNTLALSPFVRWLAIICTIIAFSDIAVVLHTDYSWKCMLLAAVLYFTRSDRPVRLVAGAAAVSWEKYAPISFLLLCFYDPDVRPRFKYAFYVFYPLHLIIIYFIAKLII